MPGRGYVAGGTGTRLVAIASRRGILIRGVASPKLVTEVRVGPQGRIVIPASLRRAAGIKPGDSLTARLDEGRLVLERRADVVTRLRRRFAGASGVSLAEELLRERREEARRDVGDWARTDAPVLEPAKPRRGTHEP